MAVTKFTDAKRKAICAVLRQPGGSRSAACQHVEISYGTFLRWMRLGASGDERFGRFVTAVEHAEAEAKIALLETIALAAPKDWRSAAWLAERRWPDEFGHRARKVVHTGPDGGAISIQFAKMTDEQLRTLAGGALAGDEKRGTSAPKGGDDDSP